jgi:hypothetical protein
MPRFIVESWAPEYGSPFDEAPDEAAAPDVDPAVELPPERWTPITPDAPAKPATVSFVDGVRRIDARVWFANGVDSEPGICASFAAGLVHCDGRAAVGAIEVGRGLFAKLPAEPIETSAGTYALHPVASQQFEALSLEVQRQMGRLEEQVARAASGADLLVLDGPLSGRASIPQEIGYIKSHRQNYLPDSCRQVVASLEPGQRTPLFLVHKAWSLYSWYLRLPGGQGHAWAGVARCEVAATYSPGEARAIADRTAATLPAFASREHRDSRAPQNLYPIGGLEEQLRRRLGDRDLVLRALRKASAQPASGNEAANASL